MNKRIEEIDYLRGFGILAVILIHVIYDFINRAEVSLVLFINIFADVFITFAVPLFFCVSGLVLFFRYRQSKVFSVIGFYRRRYLTIIPPYLLFSLIYMLFQNEKLDLKVFIKNVILGRAYPHLWFFLVLIQLYLLFPFIAKIYEYMKKKEGLRYFLIFSLLAQILWNIFVLNILPHISAQNFLLNAAFTIARQHIFVSYIFFFVLGLYICDNYASLSDYCAKNLKPIPLLVSISLLIILVCPFFLITLKNSDYFISIPRYWGALSTILIPILNVFSFAMLYKASIFLMAKKNMLSDIVRELGRYSFGLYLIHPLFLRPVFAVLKPVLYMDNYLLFEIVSMLSVTLLSYIAVYLIGRLPYSYFVIGFVRPK